MPAGYIPPPPPPNLPLSLTLNLAPAPALAPYPNDMSLRGAEAIAERRSNLLEVASTAMGLLRRSTCGLALLAMTAGFVQEEEANKQGTKIQH